MSDFRTTISLPNYDFKLTHEDSLFSIGSCFAQNMGALLSRSKFNIQVNPFGIIYNPISISQNLLRVLENKVWEEGELFFNNDRWHSFDHHSQFSNANKDFVLDSIREISERARVGLHNATVCLITLGTAVVYAEKEGQKVVANCHKIPQSHFTKRKLEVNEIVSSLDSLIERLLLLNKDMRFIFSVSPIRHLKEGMIENQLSKSTLLIAAGQLCNKWGQAVYFPAYEMMMDDLRDYRFYEKDMIHPSPLAIDYIWNHFKDDLIAEDTQRVMNRIEKLLSSAAHRAFHPESEQHQKFLLKQLDSIKQLESEFPFLDLAEEKMTFEQQLVSS